MAYFGYTLAQEHPFFSANKRTAAKCVEILAKKNKINGITYNNELFKAVKDSVDKSQEPLENYLKGVAKVKVK